MVSRTEVIESTQMWQIDAAQAKALTRASDPLIPIFKRIRKAAKKGRCWVTVSSTEISDTSRKRLRELNYIIELDQDGSNITISWRI